MNGSYTLHPVGDDLQYHWDLRARDAQTLLSSQVYAAKAGAEVGIASCRVNSKEEAQYERRVAHDTRLYFVLKAANGEILGTSQMYPNEVAREKGIVCCKECGPLATTKYAAIRPVK